MKDPWSRDYIHTLNSAYDEFFINSNKSKPVLVVDSNDLDFVHRNEDLALIDNRIRQMLHLPPFQIELPIADNAVE